MGLAGLKYPAIWHLVEVTRWCRTQRSSISTKLLLWVNVWVLRSHKCSNTGRNDETCYSSMNTKKGEILKEKQNQRPEPFQGFQLHFPALQLASASLTSSLHASLGREIRHAPMQHHPIMFRRGHFCRRLWGMRFSLPRQDVRHVNYRQVFQKMQIIWQQMVTLNPPPGGCITAGLERLQSSSSVQPI